MILSVSRRTDIPAFYYEWFFNRIQEGYLYVRNPMNPHQVSKISLDPKVVDCIVFWSKEPSHMLTRLEELKEYKYYFQFTLNAYGKDIEPKVPSLEERIDTFIRLAGKIGHEKVIWRYDPILFTSKYDIDWHLEQFAHIARSLSGHCEKCVFSFVDIYTTKNQKNIERMEISDPLSSTDEELDRLLEGMTETAKKYNLQLATCAEARNLDRWGIGHNSCIDKELIERITGSKLKVKEDGQRANCRCVQCHDIGSYDTCPHGCVYCYANYRPEVAEEKYANHNKNSPLLCDELDKNDKVTERQVKSLKVEEKPKQEKDTQLSFLDQKGE